MVYRNLQIISHAFKRNAEEEQRKQGEQEDRLVFNPIKNPFASKETKGLVRYLEPITDYTF